MKKMIMDFFRDFKAQVDDIKKGNIKRQIPNMLTFSRALSPFIIIPTMMLGKLKIAIIALIFFAITDFLDGKISKIDGVSMRLQENRGLFCFSIIFYFLELTRSLGFVPF